MSYVRTVEHRALRSKLIRRWKPWDRSTGPKSQQGKETVARNATKHGNRSSKVLDELKVLGEFLRNCRERSQS